MRTLDIHALGERLLKQHRDGDISRRRLMQGVGGLLGYYATLCAPSIARAQEAVTLRYDAYGGVGQKYFSDNVLTPVAAKIKATVNQGSFGSPEEFLAKVQTAKPGDYNFFECAPTLSYLRFTKLGLGAELDEAKIPRLKDVLPQAIADYKKVHPGGLSAVPYYLSVVTIAYNTTHISKEDAEKAGANLLIRPDLKQRIAGEDNYRTRMWYAALQTGQNPNNITDLEPIWAKIRESKNLVLKYWTTAAEQMSLLAGGSVWASDAWGVRVFNLRKNGAPIGSFRPRGLYQGVGGIFALKGSPLNAYYEIADMMLRPEVQQSAAIELGFLPAVQSTRLQVTPQLAAVPGFDPTGKYDGIVNMDSEYWANNADRWSREYRRVLSRA
ncbi:ABC transporter substrate-binding protein [Ramlibacter sp.]|uniref:ABC transporter substrate-binding protein n=1 Tax=Ramlibacter sp. TaxID=1917967 RepID=UPI003D125B23